MQVFESLKRDMRVETRRPPLQWMVREHRLYNWILLYISIYPPQRDEILHNDAKHSAAPLHTSHSLQIMEEQTSHLFPGVDCIL
jgi:hypothetical protein